MSDPESKDKIEIELPANAEGWLAFFQQQIKISEEARKHVVSGLLSDGISKEEALADWSETIFSDLHNLLLVGEDGTLKITGEMSEVHIKEIRNHLIALIDLEPDGDGANNEIVIDKILKIFLGYHSDLAEYSEIRRVELVEGIMLTRARQNAVFKANLGEIDISKAAAFNKIIAQLITGLMESKHPTFDDHIFEQLIKIDGKEWAYQEMTKAYLEMREFDLLLEATTRAMDDVNDVDLYFAQHHVIALCQLRRMDDAQDFIRTFEGDQMQYLMMFFSNPEESKLFGFPKSSEKLAVHFSAANEFKDHKLDNLDPIDSIFIRVHQNFTQNNLLVNGNFFKSFTLSLDELDELDAIFDALLQAELSHRMALDEEAESEVENNFFPLELSSNFRGFQEDDITQHATPIDRIVNFFRKKMEE